MANGHTLQPWQLKLDSSLNAQAGKYGAKAH
jgi:hypothetical protein